GPASLGQRQLLEAEVEHVAEGAVAAGLRGALPLLTGGAVGHALQGVPRLAVLLGAPVLGRGLLPVLRRRLLVPALGAGLRLLPLSAGLGGLGLVPVLGRGLLVPVRAGLWLRLVPVLTGGLCLCAGVPVLSGGL